MTTGRLFVLAAAILPLAGCASWLGDDSARKNVTGSLFRDMTKESGVRYRFGADFLDGKLIPTMGAGVAAADYDGDGWIDLFFPNQVPKSKKGIRKGEPTLETCGKLFRNRRNGTFEDATATSGIRACDWGINAMWADLDADGDTDLVVGNAGFRHDGVPFGGNTLWQNMGDGTFALVEGSGIEDGRLTVGLAALDSDGDGTADVYVGNYVDSDPGRESASGVSMMTPDEYPGSDNGLYRGLGDLRFEDVTAVAGATDPGSKTIGALGIDYDRDGHTDLYISNDQWRNTLFHNEGNGTFRDVSEETGTGYPSEGVTAFGRKTRSGMGLVSTDFDRDGWPDLMITNYANEPNTLYRNVEGAVFEEMDRAAFGGDADPSIPLSGWGVVAIDHDDDGLDDLVVSNGQILSRFWTIVGGFISDEAANFAVGEKSYAQRQFLFRNVSRPGEVRFEDISAKAGDLGRLVVVGRGLAAADFDGDGRTDLAFNPIKEGAKILRNETAGGRSLEILPVAGDDRKTVLGSVVTAGSHRMEFYVVPSYASGSWKPLHFGLGTASSAAVTIRWPDGTEQSLGELPAGAWKVRKGKSPEPLRAHR